MKRVKFLSTAVAAIAMLFASCSQSDLVQTGSEEATLVKYTLSAESATGRATHDGDGVATSVTRYICEVYTTDGAFYTRVEKPVTKGTLNTTIDLRLVASQSYDVLFWADYAGEAGNADTYYNTKTAGTVNNMSYGLKQVKYAYTYLGNEDKMDAFTGKDQIANLKGTYTKSVTLKRPFAQLNIITKDIQLVMNSAMASTMVPDKVKVSYTAPTQFNVLSGVASEEEAVSYTADVYYAKYATDPATYDYTYCTLAMNYVFAPEGESAVVEVGMDALKGSDTITGETFANIPLQRNYRTNIIGNLLTDAANYTINIAETWVGENDVNVAKVENIAQANEALKTVDNIVVTVPSDAHETDVIIPVQKEAKDVTLKFEGTVSGETITIKHEDDTKAPSTLTIEAPSGTSLNFEHPTHVVLNGVNLGVVSGVFSANTLVISKGLTVEKLIIKAGAVEIHGTLNDIEFPAGSTAVVKTSENISVTLYEKLKNNIAEGWAAKENADGTWNIERVIEAKIGDKEYAKLADAFAAVEVGETLEIVKTGTYKLVSSIKDITIKGTEEAEVVFNCEGSGSIASIPNGCTFENVAFNMGQNNYHGFQHAGTINMNNCTINGKFFSYGDMNFNGCTFNQTASDYCMWDYGKDLTYTNCTFNAAGKFLNIYNEGNGNWKLKVEGCTFNSTTKNKAALNIKATCGAVNLGWDVTIKNCTVTDVNMFPAAGQPSDALTVGGPIWQVDDQNASSKAANIVKVTVDGTVVFGGSN